MAVRQTRPKLEQQLTTLQHLIAHHQRLGTEAEQARLLRQQILLAASAVPVSLLGTEVRYFVVECILPADFQGIAWETPEQVLAVAGLLDTLRPSDGGAVALGSDRYALVRHALRHFKAQGAYAAMQQVVTGLPFPLQPQDREMATLYMLGWRGEGSPPRTRRLLGALLVLQVLLLVLVFPLLLVSVETQPRAGTSDRAADGTLTTELGRAPAYLDGLYWSVMTFLPTQDNATLPQTRAGRLISRLADGTKVLTIGVMGGLLSEVVAARQVPLPGAVRHRSRWE